jgi:hypothetical protein
MATLAEHLQARGIRIEDPFKQYQERLAAAQPDLNKPREEVEESFEEEEEGEEEKEEVNDGEVEYEEEEEAHQEATMAPRSAKKAKGLADQFDNLEVVSVQKMQTVSGLLGYPVLSGQWEVFNHETDDTTVFCLMRMQIHNGANEQEDFQLSWVDDKTFKIRLKWHKFMTKCMMTTSMDITTLPDGSAIETSPAGHPLYTSMGKNAKKLKNDRGEIWSEGLFKFKNRMDKEFAPQIFQTTVDGVVTSVLQIQFMELKIAEAQALPFSSPISKRAANLSKSRRRSKESSPNKRKKNRTGNNGTNSTAASTSTADADAAASPSSLVDDVQMVDGDTTTQTKKKAKKLLGIFGIGEN